MRCRRDRRVREPWDHDGAERVECEVDLVRHAKLIRCETADDFWET
jgi:hypothetical protein